ncbi:MAG: polyphosphate kinase 1 [Clostridia bacterium]|nr:polyphosphate kinase 1 [Clostridia bacterium]
MTEILGPERYCNRELSWLGFNRRVLAKASDVNVPLLERIKFLSITATNLDEFFMVRYASLREMAGSAWRDPAGLTADEQVRMIAEDAERFSREQAAVYRDQAVPVLKKIGLLPLTAAMLTPSQTKWAIESFRREIKPRLTLWGPDKPPVAGRRLHIGLLFSEKKTDAVAIYSIPPEIPRTWPLPKALGDGMLLIEEIIALGMREITSTARVCVPFRITRDEDFTALDGDDLLLETQESLKRRKTGDIVRLEVAESVSKGFLKKLSIALGAHDHRAYLMSIPLDLGFLLREVYNAPGLDALRYPPFTPRPVFSGDTQSSVFAAIRKQDIFLHHPYDSFDAVLYFVRAAAVDSRVLSIKQTLYRISGQSPVVRALCEAAEAGKQVTVLLELKARFDEENNMRWGEVLKRAGCEVLYGVPKLKTHSKITLVVRREKTGIRRYIHLGTGNYNDETARLYTDMGLLTADEALGDDAQSFFNMITGFSKEPTMRKLIYAPHTLRSALVSLITAEKEHARAGRPSGIVAKMNSLVDPGIIAVLYSACAAGVPIRLIVRGSCCLIPPGPGTAGKIEVRSIVGRFLEHSRAFCFENGGEPRVFLSSADWMQRNLNRRVELMFPVEDPVAKAQVIDVLSVQWNDTVGSFEMRSDGSYRRVTGRDVVDAQSVE